MRKLSVKDSGMLIIFNNGAAVVPGLFEDSTAEEETEFHNFVKEFNKEYASKASTGTFMGSPCIYVDANIKVD